MNILVTGAGGQLGREMIRAVEGTSHRYFFTTRQDLDIADTEAVRAMVQDNGIDLIVNCAAYTDVNRAESDRETADLMNHVAVGGMATVMKERGGTLIHISTDYVFDGNACVPYRETDPTCPVSVYGETKLKGEQAIIDSGCNYLIFRTSWLYSEWGEELREDDVGAVRHQGPCQCRFRPGGHADLRGGPGCGRGIRYRERTDRKERNLPLQQ